MSEKAERQEKLVVTKSWLSGKAGCQKSWLSQKLVVRKAGCLGAGLLVVRILFVMELDVCLST